MSDLVEVHGNRDGTAVAGHVEHLMIPGPCRLDPDDAELLGAPIQPHYGPSWSAYLRQVLDDLAALLGAARTYVLPGSGSAGLDAALFNLFEPGQRVLVVDSGYFGDRLKAMAGAHGLQVRVAPCVPGRPADPHRVAELLPGCDGLLVTHVETATGVRHPVAELAATARAAGAVTLVDAIASAGGEHVDMTRMGIDALVTASQKGLGGAAGLAVVALTEAGRQRVESRSRRPPTWYLDLATWDEAAVDSPDWEPTPVTMPTSLIQVLGSSVRRIRATGIRTWTERQGRLAADCRHGVRELGLRVPAPEEHAANLVVVVADPRADAIRARLADAGIMVAGGLSPFADGAFRIGLVGRAASAGMVRTLLREIARALR
ncbi:aminotransferase class V-fold PLP-dependent enzyme [Micromonospora sp. PLK6-60]|uniref:pyridoxal-phosphate-dependent aminotransferase family protein n=1 Tax=Micromonospora sp. PLK6-60 TaxID=2873383 RepID=UPI001CA67EFB|nr:aminotransferase class V-fold PLP-dependent enzyme [Micromonospora sp. PLK6-60]MBY8870772.1 aminotransferase class V-fold PLP-dependent enzyme [Micromonospora sp. PLK6-60]